jgi:uncharacterized phage protein (TIGR02216 family)
MSHNFPWGPLIRFGIGTLHLSPHEFWRSTLRELSAARGHSSRPPSRVLRQSLLDLIDQFPDDP